MRRRDFLGAIGSAGLILASGRVWSAGLQEKPTAIAGKDSRLIVHEPFPAVLETPTELLAKDRVTPVELLFVRNNQQPDNAATLDPLPPDGWKVELTGLLNKEVTVEAAELEDMEQVEHEMVIQCSGNSRSLFSESAQTDGTQWGSGGMGNVRFAGVPLSAVLKKKGIDALPKARFVAAEGRDGALPGKEDFEHSLPVDDVLSRAILALRLNGKPLPAVHGGPVRLVTPGVYGTMHMKWLGRLRFEDSETTNHHHVGRYRVPRRLIKPGEMFKSTLANSLFNWNMKVRSVILTPSANANLRGNRTTIQGVAFNDGQAAIEAVLISLDQGQTWKPAKLEHPQSRYAWTRFSTEVELSPGKQAIWSRAVDALGRSQPLDGSVHWNPEGYEWNGVHKIEVEVA
jgi:DMSO/TMAO reductase YedYZ molybdopterin-dependent catalytic subunit